MNHILKKPLVAATLLLALATAHALDVPELKEGLWKIHVISTTNSGTPDDSTYQLCRNHAYDKKAEVLSQQVEKSCTIVSDVKFGNKRSITMTCKVAGISITTKSVSTATGDIAFHSDSTTTYTPAFYGQTTSTSTQDQTWLSACPANMQPGDRILANGQLDHSLR